MILLFHAGVLAPRWVPDFGLEDTRLADLQMRHRQAFQANGASVLLGDVVVMSSITNVFFFLLGGLELLAILLVLIRWGVRGFML